MILVFFMPMTKIKEEYEKVFCESHGILIFRLLHVNGIEKAMCIIILYFAYS